MLLCLAPDRLARRYAYQVLLLEEFQRAGVEVVFAKEPERSGTPEDELLRQFQGMIAEYERAQIAERCRRGKLHRARAGAVSVLPAPHTATGMSRSPSMQTRSMRSTSSRRRSCARCSAAMPRTASRSAGSPAGSPMQGVVTRTGKTGWNTATIWGILRNPAYAGQAAYGKTHATGQPVRETRHARQRGQRSARVARENVNPEEWKPIAVPALVTAERFALVQQQLERNSRFSPRNTQPPVAAARDPHLPRVRLRVLPLLDAQQEREAARVLPLLGHRRSPSP